MNKIKIVHLVEALGGGVYTYFINLTHVLCNNPNFEVSVIYSDKRQQIDPTHISQDFHPKTNLIVIPMTREINLKSDFIAFKAVRKKLLELKPDVLHVHSSKAGILGRFAHFISPKIQAKLYYTPHGYSFLRKDVSRRKRSAFYILELLAQKLCGGTIVACGDTELKHAKRIGPSVLVRNGIDHQKISFVPVAKSQSIKNIGILGRITAARNPKLFNTLAQNNPKIQFIWIGDGELRHELTAPNIQVTGWFKDRFKGMLWLQKLDVYLQTSLWEGLPIAVLEAAARGVPVIATNIIGNKDVVKQGKTGCLFENATDFQNCLRALASKEVREVVGAAGAKRNRLLFDSTTNFKKLSDMYIKQFTSR